VIRLRHTYLMLVSYNTGDQIETHVFKHTLMLVSYNTSDQIETHVFKHTYSDQRSTTLQELTLL